MSGPSAPNSGALENIDPALAIETVSRYHNITKHEPGRFSPGPGYLEWETQPDPFRRYRGTKLHPLPLINGDQGVAFQDLDRSGNVAARPLDRDALGLFLELGLGLTAWKQINDVKWSLRANPSSGNLHPTEGYVWLPALDGLAEHPALYHYAPHEHGLEERCSFASEDSPNISSDLMGDFFFIGLSSIPWRESWKYGERAFRYCQHDTGHAMASLRYAAGAVGWELSWIDDADDEAVAGVLGLDRPLDFVDGEPEVPECLGVVRCSGQNGRIDWRDLAAPSRSGTWQGQSRRLSVAQVEWQHLKEVTQATHRPNESQPARASAATAACELAAPAEAADIASLIRQRRSAVDMDGQTAISDQAFFRMLSRTMPGHDTLPWDGYPFAPAVALFLFVHRVTGLAPGLYCLLRDPAWREGFDKITDPSFVWQDTGPATLPLYLLEAGDFVGRAASLSCTQAIAGDGAFSLGMVAQFDATLRAEGAWAYRRLFWECGIIGQVLYLEAEAAGVQATGIGCFFDDAVHQSLGLAHDQVAWQSLYHFTVGKGVGDDRLSTLPAYHHLSDDR